MKKWVLFSVMILYLIFSDVKAEDSSLNCTIISKSTTFLDDSIYCPSEYTRTGGGCEAPATTGSITVSKPVENGWNCQFPSAFPNRYLYVVCCKILLPSHNHSISDVTGLQNEISKLWNEITSIWNLLNTTTTFMPKPTPHLLSLQGYVTDNNDKPISTGDLRVTIYNSTNDIVWNQVEFIGEIKNGTFDVLLGGSTPLNLDNTQLHYMGIEIRKTGLSFEKVVDKQMFYPGGGQHLPCCYISRCSLDKCGEYKEYGSSDYPCNVYNFGPVYHTPTSGCTISYWAFLCDGPYSGTAIITSSNGVVTNPEMDIVSGVPFYTTVTGLSGSEYYVTLECPS